MSGSADHRAAPPPAGVLPRDRRFPGARERQWLDAYPDRRRLLAARRRRLERALFLEEERGRAWRRFRRGAWSLALAGLLLVGLGVPSRSALAFLGGAVSFAAGGLGVALERAGEGARRERRRRLADRVSLLVRRGNELDARARRLADALGVDPWEGASRPAAGGPGSRGGRPLSGAAPR